jgi:hypothetical protein
MVTERPCVESPLHVSMSGFRTGQGLVYLERRRPHLGNLITITTLPRLTAPATVEPSRLVLGMEGCGRLCGNQSAMTINVQRPPACQRAEVIERSTYWVSLFLCICVMSCKERSSTMQRRWRVSGLPAR